LSKGLQSTAGRMNKIAVVGLGYVGLGLAVALSKHYSVIGYDISKTRIAELQQNIDKNNTVAYDELVKSTTIYTHQLEDIKEATFYIVAVSTPAYYYEMPNLEPLIYATQELATVIKKGDIIVFESTVYPGTTEEICLPILEKFSHLKHGDDFNVGYSPERINPDDKVHTLKNITKVISAQNQATLEAIAVVYKSICDHVYPVSSIKIAEAVKVLENTQRDVNIAFMNEFAIIMHALNLNVHEILTAAQTKWSYVPFKPGLVGGHCIAVDPHYLAFKAKRVGVHPDLILAARKINDDITHFVIQELLKLLIKNQVEVGKSTIGILGVTYKENTPDIRNSLSLKLIKELNAEGFYCQVQDPLADKVILKDKYHINLIDFDQFKEVTAIILVVAHDFYRDAGLKKIMGTMKAPLIIMDIPNLFVSEAVSYEQLHYWSL